jgi:uncharacterized membrane protein YphA (DoxX/SURF4 family)
VDRLYSRFPAGSVGLALLLLRLAGGLGLVSEGIHLFTPASTASEPTGLVLLGLALVASAIMLMLGLRTTLAGITAAVGTGASALYGIHRVNPSGNEVDAWSFLLALVLVLSSSLALAGPGAYSLDARLSGWRKVKLSSPKTSRPNQWDIVS